MIPGVSVGDLQTLIEWGRLLLRVGLAGMVGYAILTYGGKAAVWLGDSRPIRFLVYAQLFVLVGAVMLGAVDGAASALFGDTLTGWGLDALFDIGRRVGL